MTVKYDADQYGLKLILKKQGSVFPAAAKFACFPAIMAFMIRLICMIQGIEYDMDELRSLYGSFIFVLGFVVVFRTGQAYNRYWDGTNLLRQMRTEWHDAAAQVSVFCMTSDKSPEEKTNFCRCIVSLFSLLHCLALQQVTDMSDIDQLEVIDLEFFDSHLLHSLEEFHTPLEKAEVVLQWIQRVILEGIKKGYIATPPPIVSRSFQEINAGMVCLSKLQCITDNPFPFPYAQMISTLLVFHWMLSPILVGMISIHALWCSIFCFISVFGLCSLNLIAQEIENPFGDDENDLCCDEAQVSMNEALLMLLSTPAKSFPDFINPIRKPSMETKLTKCLSGFIHSDKSKSPDSHPAPKSPSEAKTQSQDPVQGHSTLNIHSESAIVNISGGGGNQSIEYSAGGRSAGTPPPQLEIIEKPPAQLPPPAPPVKKEEKAIEKGSLADKPLVAKKESSGVWAELSGQLQESSQRAESLQKQSISELQYVHAKIGQLVQMISEVLNLASVTGVAVRQISNGEPKELPTIPDPPLPHTQSPAMTKRRKT